MTLKKPSANIFQATFANVKMFGKWKFIMAFLFCFGIYYIASGFLLYTLPGRVLFVFLPQFNFRFIHSEIYRWICFSFFSFIFNYGSFFSIFFFFFNFSFCSSHSISFMSFMLSRHLVYFFNDKRWRREKLHQMKWIKLEGGKPLNFWIDEPNECFKYVLTFVQK